MNPPPPTHEAKLEGLRNALLEASNELNAARSKAAREKEAFLKATDADAKARARRAVERALGNLRTATLEYEAATTNLRRELSPAGRAALDEVLSRLTRQMERYEEVSRLNDEVSAAYESARRSYREVRASLGKAHVPLKFDNQLAHLEAALTDRDKALAAAHIAHRKTLDALGAALGAADEHQRRGTPSAKLRRDQAWASARGAFAEAERKTSELTRALAKWFEADKQFGLATAALGAARASTEVQRLELRALDMLRASARLSLASIITDEALGRLVATIGEVKLLR